MLGRRGSKFCVDWRYQCPHIFDLNSNSLGKPGNMVPWPEHQPEFPGDDDGDNDNMTTNVDITNHFRFGNTTHSKIYENNYIYANHNLRTSCKHRQKHQK